MLTRIELENFQPHRKLSLDLAPLTTLVGGSNSGKSSVLRAFSAFLKNDSAGNYVTHGEKSLVVRLYTASGHVVSWHKGSGENDYIIVNPDGTETKLVKVGSDVPEEVADLIRLVPISIDGNNKLHVNYHGQLDAPFLVGSTAGYAAKVFGELTSAAKLYGAVNNGNKELKALSSLRKTRLADVEAITETLRQFDGLDSNIIRWGDANSANDRAQELEVTTQELQGISATIRSLDSSVESARATITKLSSCSDVRFDSVDTMTDKVSTIASLKRLISGADTFLTAARKAVLHKDLVGSISFSYPEQLISQADELRSTKMEILRASKSAESSEIEIRDYTKAYNEIVEQLSSLSSVCPTCGQEMPHE